MKRRFVDLSIYLENDGISDPPPFAPKIEYMKHDQSVERIAGPSRPSSSRRTTARISTRPIISIRR
jgi:hypothetical protein